MKNNKANEIYEYILKFIGENNYPPTVREIGNHFDIKSTSTVFYYLDKLRDEGRITQDKNKNRAIGIVDEKHKDLAYTHAPLIPIIGNISAGQGILAVENFEEYVRLPETIYEQQDNLFILRVVGDSMVNAGISDGDFVIVHKQDYADIGTIVVAMWQDTATVKKLVSIQPFILHPENDLMDDIHIDYSENPVILGKVVGCLKKF
ncbi:MAG: transcriptional repressor LexA [Corallococcus sp.]|nr:transcriptional repressor LexA [Corallococcus sp.]